MKTLDTMNIFHIQLICNMKRIYQQVVISKRLERIKYNIWMPHVLIFFKTLKNLLEY